MSDDDRELYQIASAILDREVEPMADGSNRSFRHYMQEGAQFLTVRGLGEEPEPEEQMREVDNNITYLLTRPLMSGLKKIELMKNADPSQLTQTLTADEGAALGMYPVIIDRIQKNLRFWQRHSMESSNEEFDDEQKIFDQETSTEYATLAHNIGKLAGDFAELNERLDIYTYPVPGRGKSF